MKSQVFLRAMETLTINLGCINYPSKRELETLTTNVKWVCNTLCIHVVGLETLGVTSIPPPVTISG